MRLLLINPNTTASISELVLVEAKKVASPGTELTMATGRFGARYVSSRASYAIAGHAALDAYAEHGAGCDAVVLACFGDPALLALKELARQPVVGMAEASCHAALAHGRRFAIVTGGERWRAMLEEFVAGIGLGAHFAGIVTVAPTGADIARDPQGALALLSEACCRAAKDMGADSVILGGAGLAGIAARIRDRVPVPLVDSLEACVRRGEVLARERPPKPASGDLAQTPGVESVGLSAALATAIGGRGA